MINHNASRFATRREANSVAFRCLRQEFYRIYRQFPNPPDMTHFNREGFPWAAPQPGGPEFYASRYWEYGWGLLESQVEPGMRVLDAGCGWSPFIFLLAEYGCESYGVDPMLGEPEGNTNFGLPENLGADRVHILKEGMEKMSFPANFFDRVYCFSVIEHIRDLELRRACMRELARVLKPGGLLVITVDYVIDEKDTTDFYDLISASGLVLYRGADFRFPQERFCIYDKTRSEDVFGFVLHKDPQPIHTRYAEAGTDETVGQPVPMYYQRLIKHFEFLDDPELIKRAEEVKRYSPVLGELEQLDLNSHELIEYLKFIKGHPEAVSALVKNTVEQAELDRKIDLLEKHQIFISDLAALKRDFDQLGWKTRLGRILTIIWRALRGDYNI